MLVAPGEESTVTAHCPAGTAVTGGGPSASRMRILTSAPDPSVNGWTVTVYNQLSIPLGFNTYNLCIPVNA
ncbi:hypothetical protein [Streptomyces sp. NPDC048106]|uniref:hypothetical protein n=1 Tax=Streptomyces sp. NPDC048106 TaxID=3155750 RepID=UPI00345602BE